MPNNTQKVHFVSLGCPKNREDYEVMLGQLDSGYELTNNADGCDVGQLLRGSTSIADFEWVRLHYAYSIGLSESMLRSMAEEEKNEACIGQVAPILVDAVSEDHEWVQVGRMQTQAPEVDDQVYIDHSGLNNIEPGDFIQVQIAQVTECDLAGVIVSELTDENEIDT